jgi:chromosome segregation ATPase
MSDVKEKKPSALAQAKEQIEGLKAQIDMLDKEAKNNVKEYNAEVLNFRAEITSLKEALTSLRAKAEKVEALEKELQSSKYMEKHYNDMYNTIYFEQRAVMAIFDAIGVPQKSSDGKMTFSLTARLFAYREGLKAKPGEIESDN